MTKGRFGIIVFDTNKTSPLPEVLQRSVGEVKLSVKNYQGRSVISDLMQKGSAKVRFPKSNSFRLEAVQINTSGGMADGDIFKTELNLAGNTEVLMTSQANEKVYRSRGGAANITTRINLNENSKLSWLPQETIMFNDAILTRRTRVSLQKTAQLIACESIIFGRTAMGEDVENGFLNDEWILEQENKVIFIDRNTFGPKIRSSLNIPAIANGYKAMSTVILAGSKLQLWEKLVRNLQKTEGSQFGASNLGDVILIRILAQDGHTLRHMLTQLLNRLDSDLIPRVWTC